VKNSSSTVCSGNVEVLLNTGKVAEANVEELDVVVLDVLQDLR
jgi:hypothetical protein